MSTHDPYDRRDELDPQDVRPMQPAQGSGCLKWILILGVLGTLCSVVCCGVLGYFFYSYRPTIANQPAEVAAIAQEITEIAIPESLEGTGGMEWNMMGLMEMRMCVFRQKEGRGGMQLMQMELKVGDPKDSEEQIKQQMRKQGHDEMKALNIEKSETKEYEIRGEKAQFTFSEGKDVATSTDYKEVRGQFKAKAGQAILHLQLEAEAWDDDEVNAMIESIK